MLTEDQNTIKNLTLQGQQLKNNIDDLKKVVATLQQSLVFLSIRVDLINEEKQHVTTTISTQTKTINRRPITTQYCNYFTQ